MPVPILRPIFLSAADRAWDSPMQRKVMQSLRYIRHWWRDETSGLKIQIEEPVELRTERTAAEFATSDETPWAEWFEIAEVCLDKLGTDRHKVKESGECYCMMTPFGTGVPGVQVTGQKGGRIVLTGTILQVLWGVPFPFQQQWMYPDRTHTRETVEGTIAHEIGHWLSLGHPEPGSPEYGESVMSFGYLDWPQCSLGRESILALEDRWGVW